MSTDDAQRFLETTTQTVSWFAGRMRDEELQLKPLFQRNPVWTHPQKSYLVDSILRGYPVPELYLQLGSDEDGEDRHVVVDGQQRIRACLEFLEDDFPLIEDQWDGAYFSDLTPALQKAFRRYKFAVRVLPDLEEELIREIFGRLNRNNMALNKQELRNATYWGSFIGTMNELATDPFWVQSGLFTANDFRRMLDVEFISELAIAALYGPQNKKLTLDEYYEAFEEEFPDEVATRATFSLTIVELKALVDWDNWTRWSKKSDFYTLFCYLASLRSGMPLAKEVRDDLTKRLDEFQSSVNAQLVDDVDGVEESVRDYARAVQRAASDLQSRRIREAALKSFLEGTPYTRPSPGRSAVTHSHLDSLTKMTAPLDEEAEDDEE